jgi:P-type Ca2+ transporter type 2C
VVLEVLLFINKDKKNMVFMGTMVRYGHGLAIVHGTGSNTELGRVFTLLQDIEKPKTPLQDKMDELGQFLSVGSMVVIVLIGILGMMQGRYYLKV